MCDSKDLLVGFLYGELDAADRRTFQAHLTSCADCREELAGLRATRGQIASWTPPEPDFGFRIVRGAAAPPPAPRFRISPAWGLAAAAVLVMGGRGRDRQSRRALRRASSSAPDGTAAARSPRSGERASPAVTPVDWSAQAAALDRRLRELETSRRANRRRCSMAARRTSRTSRCCGACARCSVRAKRGSSASSGCASPSSPAIRHAAEAGPRGDRSGHGAPAERERRRGQAIPRDDPARGPCGVSTEVAGGRGEIVRTGVALAMAITMAVPAAVGAQTTIRPSPEQRTRQDKISIMEGTLQASVGVAAKQVAKGVRSVDSNASLMFGTARAKGFPLEGHGVFFYVEIPTLDLSVMLSMEQIERSLQQRAEQQQPRADTQQVTRRAPGADGGGAHGRGIAGQHRRRGPEVPRHGPIGPHRRDARQQQEPRAGAGRVADDCRPQQRVPACRRTRS